MEYFVISAKFVPLKYYTRSSQLRRLTSFSVGCSGRRILSSGQIAVMRKCSICHTLQQNIEQVTQAYFEICAIEIDIRRKITQLSILRFLFFYISWYVFYHLLVISNCLSNISPTKKKKQNKKKTNMNFLQPVKSKNYRNRTTLKVDFSKSHFQRNRLQSYTQIILSQKVGGVWMYQIKAESVLLTVIPKTHFTQNVTCSLFSWSACIT